MIAAHSPSASTSCRTVGTVEGMEELGGDPPWRSVVVPGSITRWQTPRFLPQVVSNASVWDTAKLLPLTPSHKHGGPSPPQRHRWEWECVSWTPLFEPRRGKASRHEVPGAYLLPGFSVPGVTRSIVSAGALCKHNATPDERGWCTAHRWSCSDHDRLHLTPTRGYVIWATRLSNVMHLQSCAPTRPAHVCSLLKPAAFDLASVRSQRTQSKLVSPSPSLTTF